MQHVRVSAEEAAERFLYYYFALEVAPDVLAAAAAVVEYGYIKGDDFQVVFPECVEQIHILAVDEILFAPAAYFFIVFS